MGMLSYGLRAQMRGAGLFGGKGPAPACRRLGPSVSDQLCDKL
jgi:hypothetical protein